MTNISRLFVRAVLIGLIVALTSCGGGGGDNPAIPPIPLQIVEISPSGNALGVPLDQTVSVRFSAEIDPTSVSAATIGITMAGMQIPASVSVTGNIVTLTPSNPFSLRSKYSVNASTGVKDKAGNGMAADNNWTFTTRDGIWGASERINLGPGNVEGSKVAVDRNGNAIAVWTQREQDSVGPYRRVWANRYDSGSGWGTAQTIDLDDRSDAENVQLGMDSNGNLIVVWSRPFNQTHIWANRYVAGSGWETAQPVGIIGGSSSSWNHQIAVDMSGNAMVMWMEQEILGPAQKIWVNRYESGVGWGTPQIFDTAGNVVYATVALDGIGNGMAVWQQ